MGRTCDEMGKRVVDVHEAIGAGVGQAAVRVALQLFPRRLCNQDVVALEPALARLVEDIGPVMAR